MKVYSKLLGLVCLCLHGGVPKVAQAKALCETQTAVVVGTPGRLIDLVIHSILCLNSVVYLVIDEADRMLDMGVSLFDVYACTIVLCY